MSFRETARQLRSIADSARTVATRLEIDHGADGWVIGRDVVAIAASIHRYATVADKAADDTGEPAAEDLSWIATAAPGEVMEVFGR